MQPIQVDPKSSKEEQEKTLLSVGVNVAHIMTASERHIEHEDKDIHFEGNYSENESQLILTGFTSFLIENGFSGKNPKAYIGGREYDSSPLISALKETMRAAMKAQQEEQQDPQFFYARHKVVQEREAAQDKGYEIVNNS